MDHRSDFFFFGALLYKWLSGKPPFPQASGMDTTAAIRHTDPPPFASGGRETTALHVVVIRSLEKRPEDRHSSAHDLGLALNAVAEALLTGRAAANSLEKSIVVFPFENLSPDPENAFFADGLAMVVGASDPYRGRCKSPSQLLCQFLSHRLLAYAACEWGAFLRLRESHDMRGTHLQDFVLREGPH